MTANKNKEKKHIAYICWMSWYPGRTFVLPISAGAWEAAPLSRCTENV